MANQVDNIQILDESDPYLVRSIQASDNLQISSSLEVQNDVLVTGDLTVQGTTISAESEIVRFADNHLYLNDGYTADAAQTGGLVVNYDPIAATADTVNGTFTAGVASTSNPTVVTTGTATFSAGDLIQVSGAAEVSNNGLYEVLSHVGTTLTVRGIGVTGTVEDFTQNQFVTDPTVQGAITKVNVSVLRAGTDGNWEVGKGSVTGITFTELSTGGDVDLQDAYDNTTGSPATITTNATHGSVVIAGDQSLQVTATNGLDVNTIADFDVTTFDVQMTGTNGFSIDGTAASNVSVTGGVLTLSTLTTGDIDITAVDDVDIDGDSVQIDATEGSNFTVTANTANPEALVLSSTNAGAGAGNVEISASDEIDISSTGLLDINAGANMDIDVTGTYDMLASSTFTIAGTGNSSATADTGDLTLQTTTSGDVNITAVDDVDIDGDSVQIDATEGSNFTVTANTANPEALVISSTNAGAGAGNVEISASDEVDITSTGLMDLNAGANLDIDVTGTFDMLSSGAFSIDGTGASNMTATSGDLTVSTATTGSLILTSAGDMDVNIPTASATAFNIGDGTNTYINIDSTAAAPQIDLDEHVNLVEGAGIEVVTSTNLVAGELVSFAQPSGQLQKSDANTGTLIDGLCIGVSRGAATSGNPAQIFTVTGSLVPVLFGAAPAAADNGKPVYVSATAGQGSITPPGPPAATRVVYIVGYLQGGDGVSTTPDVLWSPQFISKGAGVS